MNPILLTDFYKVHHQRMYPKGTTLIYSNFTPRKSRIPGIDKVVFFGLQHFILEYLIKEFKQQFFQRPWAIKNDNKELVGGLEEEYKRHIPLENIPHIKALHDLGYLPIEIKALPEGTLCPIGVPCFTIKNTLPEFYWLTNYLETLISCMMWQPITSATIAFEYKKLLSKYAIETTGTAEGVQWQGHDFSMRGMSSPESAILSGMGHLLSFTGTDTIPAIYQLERSYLADGLIGASVPATEHSVMCMGTKEDEIGTFQSLFHQYPTGILSVVSDTWDLWHVLTNILPKLKDEILQRDGKLVIRPDSGDPVDILCGKNSRDIAIGLEESYEDVCKRFRNYSEHTFREEFKGVIELLWDLFGGTINDKGYKVLDPHIGAIYGDSITLARAKEICERLKAKGFASTNVILGIGSYTYQYNTRDTFGFAMKATYGEVNGEGREIFKDPVTDDGTKKSKRGRLQVTNSSDDGIIRVFDSVSRDAERRGMLETIFLDGKLIRKTTLNEIRERLKI